MSLAQTQSTSIRDTGVGQALQYVCASASLGLCLEMQGTSQTQGSWKTLGDGIKFTFVSSAGNHCISGSLEVYIHSKNLQCFCF